MKYFICRILESGLMMFVKDNDGEKVTFNSYELAERYLNVLDAGMYQIQKIYVIE